MSWGEPPMIPVDERAVEVRAIKVGRWANEHKHAAAAIRGISANRTDRAGFG